MGSGYKIVAKALHGQGNGDEMVLRGITGQQPLRGRCRKRGLNRLFYNYEISPKSASASNKIIRYFTNSVFRFIQNSAF